MSDTIINLSRRRFMRGSVAAGAGLTLGLYLPRAAAQMTAGPGKAVGDAIAAAGFEPNAFVRISPDNIVTVIAKHLEMGQGTYTGLATLVAEELDADWASVRVEGAPADAKRYNNLFWGPAQGTGGSTAMANSWMQMRQAGAAARQMLVQAAAENWQVPAVEIEIRESRLRHPASGKAATFGELADLAALQAVPESVSVKSPDAFRLIGRRVSRLDSAAKTDGSAIFTQDIQLPGQLTALVAHPPRFGARVGSFDAAAARAISGVADVVEIPTGIAVLAKDFWTAKKARDALDIEWDETGAFAKSSDDIVREYQDLAERPGLTARAEGEVFRALTESDRVIEAEFRFPYLAHAAMEPMNCVVRLGDGGCEIWNGEQMHTGDQYAVAGLLGIKPEQVRINMLYAGGSFGRRANPAADYVLEAVNIAKAIDGRAPVKLVWTREDDTRAGYFRPLYLHRIRAGLDAEGRITAWEQRIVGQSILAGTAFSGMITDGVDVTSVEGAANMPYAIPNLRVGLHSPEQAVPVLWWRSVGSTHTAYAVETFIDELAHAAGRDPADYRRALLKNHPRHLGVLDLVVAKSGWERPLPAGRWRGLAVHESFNSYVAQVAEISLQQGELVVERVVIAVDCGIAINPDIVRAQMEGGMGFGLSAALVSAIHIDEGAVAESNFHDYQVLRMPQMPRQIEVHIVPSAEPPTGVGEPATPVIAPAVANALFAATGKRYYSLPLQV